MVPQLKHKEAFQKILQKYKVSPEGQQALKGLKMLVMFAPTAAGRNTIAKRLAETGRYVFVVSDTTRPKRVKDGVEVEHEGVEYFFKSEEEMLGGLVEGKYLEAAIIHNQQVSGTSIRELAAIHEQGKTPVLEVQHDGASVIHTLRPDSFFLFILPPNFDIWMERIHKRSDMTQQELQNRLKSAQKEIIQALDADWYHFIVNDDLEKTLKFIQNMVENGVSTLDDTSARATAMRLLTDVGKHIH